MATLKRLKIEQFRNVAPGTELFFHAGFNVLLGQNGTGKTTLLNLISKALSSSFKDLEEEPFAIEYDVETTHGAVTVAIQNRPSAEPFRRRSQAVTHDRSGAVAKDAGRGADWSYRARVTAPDGVCLGRIDVSPSGAIAVAEASTQSTPIAIRSPFQPSFLLESLANLALELDQAGMRIAHDIATEAFGAYRDRFDEALGGFQWMTGSVPGAGHILHGLSLVFMVPHEIAPDEPGVFEGQMAAVRVPSVVMERVETDKPPIGGDHLRFDGRVLPFLARTVKLCGFSKGDMVLMLESRRVKPTGIEIRYENLVFVFTLDDGSAITHEGLSYGQKRLLSFLYHLALNEDIVIADELVNGLHYDWIEACLEEIGTRQAFLTSQNPILLDFLPFESAEHVRRSFLLCRRECRECGSIMQWKNLDQHSAEDFFRSYETRALQVSEILRVKGLW